MGKPEFGWWQPHDEGGLFLRAFAFLGVFLVFDCVPSISGLVSSSGPVYSWGRPAKSRRKVQLEVSEKLRINDLWQPDLHI